MIGLLENSLGVCPHSYLVIDTHGIDNTNHQLWKTKIFHVTKLHIDKLIDEDPGTTKRQFSPDFCEFLNTEGYSSKNLRMVLSQDEKWEQKYAFGTAFSGYCGSILYDIAMRRFIKEKYGVEIESLVKKWNRLCWNCFDENDHLMRCSKCHIALYCNKNCQQNDWKIHKLMHKAETWIRKIQKAELDE